jgi:hypothetical protein
MAKSPKAAAQKKKRRETRIAKQLKGRTKTYEVTRFEDGQIQEYSVPLDPLTVNVLKEQRERFREKFGREPGKGDPVFFDPDSDVPVKQGRNVAVEAQLQLVSVLEQTGARPTLIHAVKKTGFIVTEMNQANLPDDRLGEWLSAVEEANELHPNGQKCSCDVDLSDRALGL